MWFVPYSMMILHGPYPGSVTQIRIWRCLGSVVSLWSQQSGPEIIKLFSGSTQLSMKFFLLINVKMPTIVGILTCMSRKNNILGLTEPKKSRISWYFYTYEHLKSHAQLSWVEHEKSFITSRPFVFWMGWKKTIRPELLWSSIPCACEKL